jgi:hypothetical protein
LLSFLGEEDSAMALQQSSIFVADVAPLEERRRLVRRESVRDFAGVAVGVSAGALVWLALLSLLRVHV